MTKNSLINIDNDSSIANGHYSKFTKDQSTLTENSSEALIITENISDMNEIKNDVNNQNLNNHVERVRKNTIKGTVMQIEKALINDHLRVLKVS